MLKLLRKLNKKQVILIGVCLIFIIWQVWLDLKLPEYMSEITKLVQTERKYSRANIRARSIYACMCRRKFSISMYSTDISHHILQHHFLKK